MIYKAQKTAMDLRMERLRAYLLTLEDLVPLAQLEYTLLIQRMKLR